MSFMKRNYQQLLVSLYIFTTIIINIIGYFNLPDKIATHIGVNGQKSNYLSTPIYLLGSLLLIIFLSIMTLQKVGERKVKYFFVTAVLVVANGIMIITQIK